MMLMSVENMNVHLGGLHIIQGVDFHVNEGELVVIVGANGAGKSTTVRTISGLNPCASGKVMFEDAEVTNMSAADIAGKGISMVPEGRQLFPELTAKENLLMGAFHYRKNRKLVQEQLETVYNMFPVLKKYEGRIASTFSGGEQQMITIGRGLMSRPKIMMIDELSLGLAPIVIESLFKVIKELNATGMSILLIEQNARQALKIADRGYVMENGVITMEGTGMELLNNEHVKSAYLGL
ncbi:ABC transporter ATP-binding protein [Anaerobium acetethylicum]|uniref:Branched-chain amino acid transport system ATP-binding protein n=1 Tax=Anaerobium acetethylicum TaxID=1619234 RepID=A0A1D3TV45_9FIRM|nr:ABC transporter ATP-binding protein [Anaerobium acetethylicum]SCP97984.1 branched-chain amino acid transport system ATP-binding protein [Anaerobium acetethylicum]